MNTEIFVVRYGLKEIEDQCLESITKKTDIDFRLKVFDNFDLKIPLTKLWNQMAVESDADWLVYLNADCLVSQGWLTRLLKIVESDSLIAAIGPGTNSAPTRQGNFLRNYGFNYEFNLPENNEELSIALLNRFGLDFWDDEITGFCYMIQAKALNEIGYFDEHFSFYGQESMANHQLRQAGYRVGWAPGIFVYHQGGAYKDLAKQEGRDLDQEHEQAMTQFLQLRKTNPNKDFSKS